ncbi:serine/threonine-protein kinase [Conchiformibius steedae]|uniref:Protein kinase domain-containing protein n=1 Tax=Conchiformibius steedae TaxID=153493 RepID=A0A3P2A8C1_9NEIS|nr:serine/threonine-protein kinase [Conchiformibius steedae]RRD91699.1 hypothetical protein EII21_01360 [Conchiformibius steedae]
MSHPYPLTAEQLLHQNYRIVRILGSGGFGVTYLTEHIRLGNRFVIKEYFPSELAQRLPDSSEVLPHAAHRELFERGMRYFFREAQLLHRLKHPNIVPVTDLFEANGTAYFVMPYIGGETFSDYLRQHPQTNHTKLNNILLPLLDALEYLHNQRILHRDIKPQNILLAENTPILIDFGAARRFAAGPNTQSSLLFISQGYSPIEQYGGSGKLSPASDLYALSACLYQAVTGKLPLPATDRIGRRLPTLTDNPDYRVRYPQAWLAAVDKGFSLAPPKRFQTVAQMRQALNNATNGNETTEPPPAPHRQLEKAAAVKLTTKAEEQNKADKNVFNVVFFVIITLMMLLFLASYYDKHAKLDVYIAETPALSESASDIEGMDNASAVYASDASAIAAQDAASEFWGEASSVTEDTNRAEASSAEVEVADHLESESVADTNNSEPLVIMEIPHRSETDVTASQNRYSGASALGKEQIDRPRRDVALNGDEALVELRMAAEQGNVNAQYNLALMYYNGDRVSTDNRQAAEWFRKAAEQGYASGQLSLGVMYEHGEGINQDREQAIYWYRQAAQQNDNKEAKKFAQAALKRLYAQ